MRWLAAVVAAVLLAGCADVSEPAPSDTFSAASSPSATPDLTAMRKAAGIADCPASSTAAAVTGGLPDLTLECLGGDSSVRLAGLRGPLLVNFWAQWCDPCRAEAGHLAAFASTSTSVKVLGVNYTDPQPELAIEFAQLTAMTYPHVVDPDAATKAPMGISGIPASFLVDADGRIVARHFGAFTSLEDVQSWVTRGLGK